MKLILIGFMGSGKTTISQLLGKQLSQPVLDLDREIERQSQQTIPQIFAESGEAEFRRIEHEVLQSSINFGGVLATGGGTPLRDDNIALIKQAHAPVVLLVASPQETFRRINQQSNRPLGNQLDVAGIRQLQKVRQPFYDQCADLKIITDGLTPKEIVQRILDQVQRRSVDF